MILFLSEMLTATAMGKFETEIAKAVILSIFVPLVISSGGNSGSQASTLIIRAMAVGEVRLRDWWRVMRREIQSGLSLGAILGVIGFIRISTWALLFHAYGPYWPLLALTVGLSLIGIVLWGTPGRFDAAVPAAPPGGRPGHLVCAVRRNAGGRLGADHLLYGGGIGTARNIVVKLQEEHGAARRLGLLLVAAAAFYVTFIARTAFRIGGITYFTLVDDAMVSMRYAQHLAHGSGLVWNIGQRPVEGFTNPAWMLLMAALHLLPLPAAKVSLAVMAASALILLANIVVVYKVSATLRPASQLAPLLAAGITALYYPLIFWSLRGMEVGLLVLLIDASLLLALHASEAMISRQALTVGALLALAVLTRLDTLIQAFILLGYLAVARTPRKTVALPLLLVLLTTVGVLLFQRGYFGDFLPNTYYQKMAGTTTWERVRNGLLVFYQHALWDTALPAAFSFVCLAVYKDLRRPETYLLAALFAAQCAYSVWVGGDYAEPELDAANRFITQGMPALILLFSVALDRVLHDERLRWNAEAGCPGGRGCRAGPAGAAHHERAALAGVGTRQRAAAASRHTPDARGAIPGEIHGAGGRHRRARCGADPVLFGAHNDRSAGPQRSGDRQRAGDRAVLPGPRQVELRIQHPATSSRRDRRQLDQAGGIHEGQAGIYPSR